MGGGVGPTIHSSPLESATDSAVETGAVPSRTVASRSLGGATGYANVVFPWLSSLSPLSIATTLPHPALRNGAPAAVSTLAHHSTPGEASATMPWRFGGTPRHCHAPTSFRKHRGHTGSAASPPNQVGTASVGTSGGIAPATVRRHPSGTVRRDGPAGQGNGPSIA